MKNLFSVRSLITLLGALSAVALTACAGTDEEPQVESAPASDEAEPSVSPEEPSESQSSAVSTCSYSWHWRRCGVTSFQFTASDGSIYCRRSRAGSCSDGWAYSQFHCCYTAL